MPEYDNGKDHSPLPYMVILSSTKEDRMQCDNCGNSGQTVLITGGEKLSQYHMMVDSPYYSFLCTHQKKECRSGKWIAINKNQPHPVVKIIDIGGPYEISDLWPSNTPERTWLHVLYTDGRATHFEFDNNH